MQKDNLKLSSITPESLKRNPRLVPGTEPHMHEAGVDGVLVLHGYTGSPWEVRPLADRFADRGWSVALPVLAGHGTSVEELEQTSWPDWYRSAREAAAWLHQRCDRIHVVGLSMGGLLAMKLLTEPGFGWRSAVLLAPALTLGGFTERGVKWMHRVGWPRRIGKNPPELARGLLPPTYWQIPIRPTASLLELAVELRAHPLRVDTPVLVMHGSLDRTIPMRRARRMIHRVLPGAQHVVIPGAGHILPRTQQAQRVLDAAQEFALQASAAAR